jgi:hypothetical protein
VLIDMHALRRGPTFTAELDRRAPACTSRESAIHEKLHSGNVAVELALLAFDLLASLPMFSRLTRLNSRAIARFDAQAVTEWFRR